MKRVLDSIYSDEEEEEDDPLQNKFKTLELEWDSIKQSISRSDRRKPITAGDHYLFQFHHNSPKELMSILQLQNKNSPPRFDFDDGGIKGRRLFDESEVGSDDNGEIESECFDVDGKSEVSTEYSCKGFESFDENCYQFCGVRRSPERGMARVVVVKSCGSGRRSVGRLMVCVVVLLALAIVVFKCSGEDEHVLVPT